MRRWVIRRGWPSSTSLSVSDRAPVELRRRFGMESNLLAHHLDVLERVGLIERSRSSGDGRRRYVHLVRDALEGLAPTGQVRLGRALFVCSAQLGALPAGCRVVAPGDERGRPSPRAPIRPTGSTPGRSPPRLEPGLDLGSATPHDLAEIDSFPPLVITVCDQAHEELDDDSVVALVDPGPGPGRHEGGVRRDAGRSCATGSARSSAPRRRAS